MAKVAVIKTQQNESSVEDFIDNIEDDQRREDCKVILKLMQKFIKEKPKMWGASMIGFGIKRYKSERSGREVDWFKTGFSPRKNNISLHLVMDVNKNAALLNKLGKHKTGSGCLYINKLADVDQKILEQLIKASAE